MYGLTYYVILRIIKLLLDILPCKIIREIKDRNGFLCFRRSAYINTTWFGVCKHEFWQKESDDTYDKDPYLHNHPREFWTYIVDNGYIEEYINNINDPNIKREVRGEGYFGYVDNKLFHKILTLNPLKYTRTLTFGKKHTGNWGYFIDGKIVSNEEYRKQKNSNT